MARQSTPAMPPTADGGVARRAVDRCREAGIVPLPFLPEAGLTADAFDDAHSRILDDLPVDLARRYLAEPALTISQIAWLLGFQEVSALRMPSGGGRAERPRRLAPKSPQ